MRLGRRKRESQHERLVAARASVESRLMRIGIIASALSLIGLDAEIGDLPISKLIRNFWNSWTPRKLAELEQCLKNTVLHLGAVRQGAPCWAASASTGQP